MTKFDHRKITLPYLKRTMDFKFTEEQLAVQAAEQRVKDRIDINIDQVVKVFFVLACHRIAGLIGEGEGIDESRQRAFQQLHERFFNGVFLRAVQDRVFEDVRYAIRVLWCGAKVDAENFVFVVVDDREQPRACALVFVQLHK